MTYKWEAIIASMLATLVDDEAVDAEDRAVTAILMVLHDAVEGKIDLTDLAVTAIEFARPGRYFPELEALTARLKGEAESN
jgi:hypothetical protein